MGELKIDSEFCLLVPAITSEAYSQLENSIRSEGCRDALVVWNGTIIDGHNRYGICQRHSIPFRVVEGSFESRDAVKVWIIQNQFARRNLTTWQRVVLALKLKGAFAAKAKAKLSAGGGDRRSEMYKKSGWQESAKAIEPIDSNAQLARIAGVSHYTIKKGRKILAEATPEELDALDKGDASINQVYAKIKGREHRAGRIAKARKRAAASVTPLNKLGKFPIIYADPPYRYEEGTVDSPREIGNQYPTMDLSEIKELPVADIAADDCILFLWTPAPKLAEAIHVVESWGFDYRTCMVWEKESIGLGYYARQKHELLLVAMRGALPVPEPSNRPESVIHAPREEHSKKPDKFYEIIEAMYPELPRIELFAREKREGWAVWGNEV